ncbi:MAG: hypothetical protein RIC14_03395 [Filomicrobium sp.]
MPVQEVAICGLVEVEETAALFKATHLLSLIEPGRRLRRPDTIERANHLVLMFKDTWNPRLLLAPAEEHIVRINEWVDSLPSGSRLLVHCFAGVGRSPGVALGILAKSMPPERAVEMVFELRPIAAPNALVVKLWDQVLGFDGKLLGALEEAIGVKLED